MTAAQKQIKYNLLAFLLLFSVSFYRQASLRLWPGDKCRTYILYACYMILIICWIISIHTRVTQKTMRTFLTLEALVMAAGLTLRFFQDTFWIDDLFLMRVSGLWVEATLLPCMAFGIFAALGIGQSDQYRPPKPWYLLLAVTLAATFISVTDEQRHFLFYIDASEPQPNLNFHPNIGIYLAAAFGMGLMILRIMLIYKRNRTLMNNKFLKWFVPLLEPILVAIFALPFFVPGWEKTEVIELFARIYYIEVLTWEIYIYLGLVPANTSYAEIFRHATTGMIIQGKDGTTLVSQAALPPGPGCELHQYEFGQGTLFWNKDVTLLHQTIAELNRTAEILAQKGALLSEELKTKNEEARLNAKNQIYDGLTREVQGQLDLMEQLIHSWQMGQDSQTILHHLCLLGTYVKQRCNLRLIQKDTGTIPVEDLHLSLEAMSRVMNQAGMEMDIIWDEDPLDPIEVFDQLDTILEQKKFDVKKVWMTIGRNAAQISTEGMRTHV